MLIQDDLPHTYEGFAEAFRQLADVQKLQILKQIEEGVVIRPGHPQQAKIDELVNARILTLQDGRYYENPAMSLEASRVLTALPLPYAKFLPTHK